VGEEHSGNLHCRTYSDYLLTSWEQVLIIHGTEDKVTSYKASQAFYDKLPTDTKKELSLFDVRFLLPFNEFVRLIRSSRVVIMNCRMNQMACKND